MPGPETKSKDEIWKLPIKLGAAMLKHYAAKAVGEEAVKLVVEQALDSSKDGAIAKIDEWLKSSKAKKAVEKALEQAATQFGKSAPAQALTAAGFVWRNTAGVKKAVENLAKSSDETELHSALVEALRLGLPEASEAASAALISDGPAPGIAGKLDPAADEFLRHLRQSLLPLKDVGPAIVNQAVLRMEGELAGLRDTARDIQLSVRRTEESLSRFIMQWQNQAEGSLQGAFIDYSSYITDKTRGFVGRQFVFDALDRFLDSQPGGYFIIRGDPGIGKSAVMARLVKERQYAHHFNIAAEGVTSSKQFFMNACAQLIARYNLEYMSLPVDAGQDNNFLKKVLLAAAGKSPKVVLAIDALDEASDEGRGRRTNPLQLPPSLPSGVYIVVTTRRTDKVLELEVESHQVLELESDSEGNLRDIVEYIEQFAGRPGMVARLGEWGVGHKNFVDTLQEKSEGNFMYLRHMLPAIEQGRFMSGALDELPKGLMGYYQNHWEKMRGEDAKTFVRVNQKIIAALATAYRPVSLRFIAKVTRLSLAEAQWTIEKWREFLHESPGGEATEYRIYHASYRDFLAAQVRG